MELFTLSHSENPVEEWTSAQRLQHSSLDFNSSLLHDANKKNSVNLNQKPFTSFNSSPLHDAKK